MNTSILITGGAGQVGTELIRLKWPDGFDLCAPTQDELDITDPQSVEDFFATRSIAAVINAAGYTAVDQAEQEVAKAFLVNAQAPAYLAEATRRAGAPIIHISTDYVFDGVRPKPYCETDPTNPLGAYGASKLAGELAVRAGNPRMAVVRTAWVLSAHRANFLKTMVRLAETHPSLSVVADQTGSPTSARDLAHALQTITLRFLNDSATPTGVFHFANAGSATWHELAEHIFAWHAAHGASRTAVSAISTADYPTAARRPKNSQLNTDRITEVFGIRPRPWQQAVDDILLELAPIAHDDRGNS